jgi:hypothetical protein
LNFQELAWPDGNPLRPEDFRTPICSETCVEFPFDWMGRRSPRFEIRMTEDLDTETRRQSKMR